jgi:TPR repeat protein
MTDKTLKINTLLFAIIFLSSFTFAHANDYADGFIAAESGDYETAATKWIPLAEAGHPAAQFNIGLMYHSGIGVYFNEQEAVKWYKKSAENGFRPAQEFLVVGYTEGWFGLQKDKNKAKYWEDKLKNAQ